MSSRLAFTPPAAWLLLMGASALCRPALSQTLAGSRSPLTLPAALAEAHQGSPSLGAAQARLDAARVRAEAAGAWMPPMVGLTAMEVPAGTFDPTRGEGGVVLMASQTFPWPGKRRTVQHAASRSADADAVALHAIRRSLEANVAVAYVRLAYDERDRVALAEQEALLREIADIATRRYAVGAGSQPDALRAGLERTRIGAERAALRARRAENVRVLTTLLAREDASADSLALGTSLHELVTAFEALHAEAPADTLRPEMRLAQARRQAAQARLDASRYAFRPDVTVTAEYALVRKPYGMDGADMWSAGVAITVPIAPWSRRTVEADQATWTSEVSALDEEVRGLRIQIAAETRALDAQVAAARDALRLYEADLVPQAEIAFRAALGAYAVSAGDLTALLDARRTLTDLRRSVEAARARYAEALVRSAQARGRALPLSD